MNLLGKHNQGVKAERGGHNWGLPLLRTILRLFCFTACSVFWGHLSHAHSILELPKIFWLECSIRSLFMQHLALQEKH